MPLQREIDSRRRLRSALDQLHPTILRAPGFGAVVGHRLAVAVAVRLQAHGVDATRYQFSHHRFRPRSEEHTSELQSLMRTSYAVFCLKKKTTSASITQKHNSSPMRCYLNTIKPILRNLETQSHMARPTTRIHHG